jgi:hypothetical protein
MAYDIRGDGSPIQFLAPSGASTISLPQTGTAATLAGTETLTNKTLPSPTLTSPTITNPTISATAVVAVTSSTVTLGATHVGRTVVLNRATGIAVTLPAATGTGSIYKLWVKTTFTGASTVKTAATTEAMNGTAILFADGGATVVGFNTTATDNTIDLLGTSNSTGGIFGATILLQDIETGLWSVEYVSDAGGTEATPFSEAS